MVGGSRSKRRGLGILLIGLCIAGASSAWAQTANPTIVDLGKGKISGPLSFEAKEASDVVMDKYVYDAAGKGHTWHSHPPAAGIVTKGSVTFHIGNETGCTSKTYTAGQAFYDPPNVPHVAEPSKDFELVVTFVGVPVGAPVSKVEPAPTGPNCPAQVNPGVARTELARTTIQGATRAAATGDSEMIMQFVTTPPNSNFRDGWYSSPAALFAIMKSGSLTVFTRNAAGCTKQTYTAGQGLFVPADQPIFVRNDSSSPAEVYATRLGLPVGAAPRVDAPAPSGANCPNLAQSVSTSQPAPTSQLPRTGGPAGALAILGLGLAGAGTVARALTRRR